MRKKLLLVAAVTAAVCLTLSGFRNAPQVFVAGGGDGQPAAEAAAGSHCPQSLSPKRDGKIMPYLFARAGIFAVSGLPSSPVRSGLSRGTVSEPLHILHRVLLL